MRKNLERTETPSFSPVLHVAAYIRVSTDSQVESGLGLDAQKTQCRAMATVKGWPEPTFYCDAGISGTKDESKRPGLAEVLLLVRNQQIDVLIVSSLDRLGRDVILVLQIAKELRQYHVDLVSCKESLDTGTAQGQFVFGLFALLAEWERSRISERTIAALQERTRRDGETGGRLPYGYLRTSTGVIIDEEAAKVVRRIFALHKRGLSLRMIATEACNGKQWCHTSIVEILKNKDAYRGGRRGKSEYRWPMILK